MTGHDAVLSRLIFLKICAILQKKQEIRQVERITPAINQSKKFFEMNAM